jgi:predicted O-methyltransferase YrrM
VVTNFAAAWAVADQIPGWLTAEQGRELWDAAGGVPAGGTIVEIGSHRGRSTTVLASAAAATGATVIAIDPFVDGRLFGGAATRREFETNIGDAGLADVVDLRVARSAALRRSWDRRLDLVYVDGKHDYWTTSDDLRWAEHLPIGAPLLMHDTFSSIGVTAAVLVRVLPGRSLRYVRRAGSLAVFERGAPSLRDRVRIVRELPWFLRNVVVKIGLRVLRAFGHRRPDPY